MYLWIRSQDRERITQCKYLYIYDEYEAEDEEVRIYNYIDENAQHLLGIYKTKERALEVLDEIQEKINNIHKDYLMACMKEKGTYEVIAWRDFTYEMPKE